MRLGYCILLKAERMGLGKVYGVGANNEVNVRVDGTLAFAICGGRRVQVSAASTSVSYLEVM